MDQDEAPRRRTGGRSARVREAVLAAALAQVADHGFEGLRIAEVAARAGVAESTVYRRWPTPAALVADAVTELAAQGNPVPDTGDLRADLLQAARQIVALLERPAMTRLVGTTLAMSHDAEVDAARIRFWDERFARTALLIEKATARGEIPGGTDPRDVLETMAAPIYFRVLVGGAPPDDAFVTRCVDDALALIAARTSREA
ncbi:TetR family transcriptional regulator [Tsukamurella pulmonis]|uniref:TetR/AcrR family transcriptional regulator n=1 Tax=Tsukamurella pulmonis TaxID=47312 RepID=UPI00079CAD3C|nr:TetR/AcrR family transcriptional regulator [Tsukamurella pulmonis]KXP09920.1 TetR family transcriptional regulator [Tsukamurella pulmonis]RDH11498.1 TetR/AcrR family transcriptional regulator [Tsukamurella pulmonis]